MELNLSGTERRNNYRGGMTVEYEVGCRECEWAEIFAELRMECVQFPETEVMSEDDQGVAKATWTQEKRQSIGRELENCGPMATMGKQSLHLAKMEYLQLSE